MHPPPPPEIFPVSVHFCPCFVVIIIMYNSFIVVICSEKSFFLFYAFMYLFHMRLFWNIKEEIYWITINIILSLFICGQGRMEEYWPWWSRYTFAVWMIFHNSVKRGLLWRMFSNSWNWEKKRGVHFNGSVLKMGKEGVFSWWESKIDLQV